MVKTAEKESVVELTIPGKPEFLRVVRLLVSGYASRCPLSFEEVENVKVAVSEACNNAIQYAGGGDESTVRIRCWQDDVSLVFEVTDKGKGFSPSAGEDAPADDLDESGLGFLLIQTLMDDVSIESEPGAGTTVTMTKKFTTA